MLDQLFKLHTLAVEGVAKLRFNKDDDAQRALIALYATIIEQSGSIIQLAHANKSAGIDSILRSALEAYADLRALLRDPEYVHNMNAAFFYEWIRLFKTESGASMAGGEEEIKDTLNGYELALAELKSKKRPPLKNKDKFALAGLEASWLVVYNMLCAESHNNFRSLIDRHMDASSGVLKMNLSKPDKDFTAPLFTTAEILLGASLEMHEAFVGGDRSIFQSVQAELIAMRDALPS